MTPPPLRVAVVGLGPQGRRVAALVARSPEMTLAGLVEPGVGADTSEFGLPVLDDVEKLESIDVAIVCRTPYFDRLAPTLRQCLQIKAHVVSDCAEMAWPWLKHPHLSDVLANEARRAGVALIGVGVQPGFALDTLPLAFAATVSGVTRVTGTRTVRVADLPVDQQRLLGLGLEPVPFRKLADQGRVGRPGLGESVTILAQGLGRHPRQTEVKAATLPQTADGPTDGPLGPIQAGRVAGLRQSAAWRGDGLEIDLTQVTTLADTPAEDAFEIIGDRTVRLTVPTGTPDSAAAAVLVNVARVLPRLPAGVRTVLDLPTVGSR